MAYNGPDMQLRMFMVLVINTFLYIGLGDITHVMLHRYTPAKPFKYGTAQMQGNTRARVARGSLAFCPRVTRSHYLYLNLNVAHKSFIIASLM